MHRDVGLKCDVSKQTSSLAQPPAVAAPAALQMSTLAEQFPLRGFGGDFSLMMTWMMMWKLQFATDCTRDDTSIHQVFNILW